MILQVELLYDIKMFSNIKYDSGCTPLCDAERKNDPTLGCLSMDCMPIAYIMEKFYTGREGLATVAPFLWHRGMHVAGKCA